MNKKIPVKATLIIAGICFSLGFLVMWIIEPSKTIKKEYEQKIEVKEKKISELKSNIVVLTAENSKLKLGFKERIRKKQNADGSSETEIDRELNVASDTTKNTSQDTQNKTTTKTEAETNTETKGKEAVEINVKKYMLGASYSVRQDIGLEFLFPVYWRFNGKVEPTYNPFTRQADLRAGLLFAF